MSRDIDHTLALPRDEKRVAKKALLLDLVRWCDENPDEALEALAESAAEIIDFLQGVDPEHFG